MSRKEEIAGRKEEIALFMFLAAMAAFTSYCGWVIFSSWRWIMF